MQPECKLIIFDLDGVLLDAKMIHFEALNLALKEFAPEHEIEFNDHLSNFDGLPTAKKLLKLNERGLPKYLNINIAAKKQQYTRELLNYLPIDQHVINIHDMFFLLNEDYYISIASNATSETTNLIADKFGLTDYTLSIYGNDQVRHPKPNPEIYLRCMIDAGVGPKETLVVEDSEVGREAVYNCGAKLCPVNNMKEDVNYERIVAYAKSKDAPVHTWKDEKLNILIPMAGQGSRFAEAGFTFPKPLIEVNGKPMIQLVVENLNMDAHYVFLVRTDDYYKYNLNYMLKLIAPNCDIVQVDMLTEGAACTTLLAKSFVDNDNPLVIANSDQYLEWDSSRFMYAMSAGLLDAGIATFTSTHPKWSFAKVENGNVVKVAEKKPISDVATTGIYYWRHGSDYVKYAEQMIEKDIRVNNEFYVCPVFNEAIKDGKIVKTFQVDEMWGLGTPEDLEAFLGRK